MLLNFIIVIAVVGVAGSLIGIAIDLAGNKLVKLYNRADGIIEKAIFKAFEWIGGVSSDR